MFHFYIKEKFDVLRMFRLLVSSRYRRVRKIKLHFVLFALLFIQYLKRIIWQESHGNPRLAFVADFHDIELFGR